MKIVVRHMGGNHFSLYLESGGRREMLEVAVDLRSSDEAVSRLRVRYPEATVMREDADPLLTVDEVRKLCPPCADKMLQQGITRIRQSVMVRGGKEAAGECPSCRKT